MYKRVKLIDNILSSGAITFVIGFTGCVGALRENTALLAAYAIFLAILLLLEMTAGILGFIFKDWIKGQATSGFQAFIVHYRDDPDQQNLIDWIQEGWVSSKVFIVSPTIKKLTLYFCFLSIQLQCCGIEGPHDWDQNVYFNCSSASVGSREACGVPFSCCKPKVDELIKNVQCGYDVRRQDYVSYHHLQKTHTAKQICHLTSCSPHVFTKKRIRNSTNFFAKTCGEQHIQRKTKLFLLKSCECSQEITPRSFMTEVVSVLERNGSRGISFQWLQ